MKTDNKLESLIENRLKNTTICTVNKSDLKEKECSTGGAMGEESLIQKSQE